MTAFAARSDPGRVRPDNQDRYVATAARGVTLLAVADGVGGEAGGDVASAAAIRALTSTFDLRARDTPAALAAAVRAANDAVLGASSEHGHPAGASTLVAAAVRGDRLAIANLGDSRAYLVRSGSARQVTADHSGDIPHSITRFVGDPRGVAPDVFIEILRSGDRVVLCSDGLTRHVAPDEIAAACAGADADRAARSLVELANSRGGLDNITVVVYERQRTLGGARLAVAGAILVALAVAAVALSLTSVAP